jgi:hypothetical protein
MKMGNNAPQIFTAVYGSRIYIFLRNTYRRVSATKQSDFFVANLNSFTDSTKNSKVFQRASFGICIVTDASHIMQYKIINLWETKLLSRKIIYILYQYESPSYFFVLLLRFFKILKTIVVATIAAGFRENCAVFM